MHSAASDRFAPGRLHDPRVWSRFISTHFAFLCFCPISFHSVVAISPPGFSFVLSPMAAPAPRAPLPSCTLEIKAVPNAPRNAVVGWLGDALKVKVHAPALEGRANEELCEFLADALDLPRRAVTVLRGDKSRQKVVRLEGLDLAEAKRRLTGR